MRALIFVFLMLPFGLSAQQPREKSAFESALEQNTQFQTSERWVEVDGTRYREVEYRGSKYYIKFTERKGDTGELDCGLSSDRLSPHMVEMKTQLYRRTKLFVSFLQETCEKTAGGHSRRRYMIDPRLGFTIPDGNKALITNKKVFLSPQGLGFSGNW